ncbi:hypothetical protein TNCV_776281 [Trichonephila clavipes]|nr:hypothetical protein TNCV_776281 [Trichonephila clavipes]
MRRHTVLIMSKIFLRKKSLDLIPIDQVMEASERVIVRPQNPPNTCQKLKSPFIEERGLLLQDEINNLICSIITRCEACAAARGGHIRY